jgi:hypothetical protein
MIARFNPAHLCASDTAFFDSEPEQKKNTKEQGRAVSEMICMV